MKNIYNHVPVSNTLILGSFIFAFIFMSSCKKDDSNAAVIAQIQLEYTQAENADKSLVLYTDSLRQCRNYQNLPKDSAYYIMNIYRFDSLYHFYDINMMNRFYGLRDGTGGMMGSNMSLNFTINGMPCLTAFELLHKSHSNNHPF